MKLGLAGGMLLAVLAGCAPAAAPQSTGAKAISPTLFVAAKRGNTIAKVDLATGKEVLRLPSCTNPHELATSPDGLHVALACYGGTTVDIFRTGSLEKLVRRICANDGDNAGIEEAFDNLGLGHGIGSELIDRSRTGRRKLLAAPLNPQLSSLN